MKLSAVIVCYYPNLNDLAKNIDACIHLVDKLILWHNTPAQHLGQYQLATKKYGDKLEELTKGENVGIATALNLAVNWCQDNNYTHILTLDQDSCFNGDSLSLYKAVIDELPKGDVGIYAANPVSGQKPDYALTERMIEVGDAITSGSIIPLDIFKKVGGFWDDLFIDAVDFEFCYRVKLAGYKIIIVTSAIMQHKLGYPKKSFFGFTTYEYSAFRTYFIVRNHIVIWRLYPKLYANKYRLILIKGHILSRLIKIILAEKNKATKIKAVLKGIKHGFMWKTKPPRSISGY